MKILKPKFSGLNRMVAAVVQDAHTRDVIWAGNITEFEFRSVLRHGLVTVEAGSVSKMLDVRVDCDGDAVLMLVESSRAREWWSKRDPVFSQDPNNLVMVVVQDTKGDVRMVAYANAVAWQRTLDTKHVTFWSRSRKELWTKGKESGNFLQLQLYRVSMLGDVILCRVDVLGKGLACHTGTSTCFFRSIFCAEPLLAPLVMTDKEQLEWVDADVRPGFRPHPCNTAA